MALSGSTDFSLDRDKVITAALRVSGVIRPGQSASTEQITTGSEALNLMVKSWVADGLQLHILKNLEVTLAANQQSYSVGLGQDINIPRPERFINIIYRDSSTFDRTLDLISRNEYWSLSNKLSKGSPTSAYYDPQYGVGKLYLWPVLNTIDATTPEKIVVIYQDIFDDLDASTDDFEFPSYYFNAIKWGLAVQISFEYPEQVSSERIAMLTAQYREEKQRAMEYDQEDASLFIQPESRWYRGFD